jgi:hypothetical protein
VKPKSGIVNFFLVALAYWVVRNCVKQFPRAARGGINLLALKASRLGTSILIPKFDSPSEKLGRLINPRHYVWNRSLVGVVNNHLDWYDGDLVVEKCTVKLNVDLIVLSSIGTKRNILQFVHGTLDLGPLRPTPFESMFDRGQVMAFALDKSVDLILNGLSVEARISVERCKAQVALRIFQLQDFIESSYGSVAYEQDEQEKDTKRYPTLYGVLNDENQNKTGNRSNASDDVEDRSRFHRRKNTGSRPVSFDKHKCESDVCLAVAFHGVHLTQAKPSVTGSRCTKNTRFRVPTRDTVIAPLGRQG